MINNPSMHYTQKSKASSMPRNHLLHEIQICSKNKDTSQQRIHVHTIGYWPFAIRSQMWFHGNKPETEVTAKYLTATQREIMCIMPNCQPRDTIANIIDLHQSMRIRSKKSTSSSMHNVINNPGMHYTQKRVKRPACRETTMINNPSMHYTQKRVKRPACRVTTSRTRYRYAPRTKIHHSKGAMYIQ